MTVDDAAWMMARIPDWPRLGFCTGLRPGELRRLRWRDVDFERGLLHVRNTEAGRTKTGAERAVPVYDVTRRVLAACERRCAAFGGGLDPERPCCQASNAGS